MSMRFVFSSLGEGGQQAPVVNGAQARLWLPVGSMSFQVGSATVQGNEVEFGIGPLPDYAVTLDDADGRFARTGPRQPTPFDLSDGSGTFTGRWVLYRAQPVTFTAAQLSQAMPSTPLDLGQATVTSLSVAIGLNELIVQGAATVSVPIISSASVNFTYRCSLEPETSALAPDRLLKVVTKDLALSGAGGLGGAIVHVIVTVLGPALEVAVSGMIRDFVQEELDDEIAEMLSDEEVPDAATVTVEEVSLVFASHLSVTAVAAIPLEEVCAVSLSSGSVRGRRRDEVAALRRVREEALRGTPRGESYIGLLRQHNRELVSLLARHPRLLRQADEAVPLVLDDLGGADPVSARLSERTAREVTNLMQHASRYASPELAVLLRTLVAEVADFVDRPVGEVLRGR